MCPMCRPEALAEGSPPGDAVPSWGRRAEQSEEGRRPERSEGCLAHARQDKKWTVGVTKKDGLRSE